MANCYIDVLREPITRTEYRIRKEGLESFINSHSDKIRTSLVSIGKLTTLDIDYQILMALGDTADDVAKGRYAWHALAWHIMFQPHSHKWRYYRYPKARLLKELSKQPSSLYMFAVFITQEPRTWVYSALKKVHPGIARQYANYCKNYFVLNEEYPGLWDTMCGW